MAIQDLKVIRKWSRRDKDLSPSLPVMGERGRKITRKRKGTVAANLNSNRKKVRGEKEEEEEEEEEDKEEEEEEEKKKEEEEEEEEEKEEEKKKEEEEEEEEKKKKEEEEEEEKVDDEEEGEKKVERQVDNAFETIKSYLESLQLQPYDKIPYDKIHKYIT
jgi:cobalamin biosynthesis protein CobT